MHLTNILITFLCIGSVFFSKSGVRFEIWTLLFFRASFDLSNLRGQIEKTSNFIVDFDVEKWEDFDVILSESINFDYLRP